MAANMALGQAALDDQSDERRTKAIADALAGGMGPDMESQAEYESKFYNDIGVGWWSTHLLDIGIFMLAAWLKIGWLYFLVATFITGHIVFSAYKVTFWRRIRDKRRNA